jgi:hypothetical protein
LITKKQSSDSALPVFIPIAINQENDSIYTVQENYGEGVFQMVDYQPIAELVKQIPADTWKILQEIQKRRPAMMLDELLDKRERAPKQPPNAPAGKAS